jgi:hypothetical protein
MIKIIIMNSLRDGIYNTFKKDSLKIYSLLEGLKENPKKGKVLGNVENINIREIKYKTYRFYFVLDGHKLFLFNKNNINEILIRFVRMSKKNNQEKVINEIKWILKKISEEGFD